MADPCFIDTNILMYAVGSEHPLKQPSLNILKKISDGDIMAVTDTEVFQEVAYRYWSQRKWPIAVQVLADYQLLFHEIYSVEKEHLELYYELLSKHAFLSPRDAIHAAVMQAHEVELIYTVDRAFKKLPFLEVCEPV